MNVDDIRRKKQQIMGRMDATIDQIEKGSCEAQRIIDITERTSDILDDLDNEFRKITKLTMQDTFLLLVAVGLQLIRQYMITNFPERLDDQTAADNTLFHDEDGSFRHHRYYNPSLGEIVINPVPFDANLNAGGALAGAGRLGHRVKAIGHDPLLGLVFGTANILTSTLTTSDMVSYHIYSNENDRDYFRNKARTELVLKYTVDNLLHRGKEGKIKFGASLIKEIIHLRSDLNTTYSLPLPFISVIDAKKASELASYGLDMSNVVAVGKQASYSIAINSIISMIHYLMRDYNDGENSDFYMVRTRKILSYSNLISSSTNVAVTLITEDYSKLDLGGLGVALYRLITDTAFIRKVKEEFVFGSYKKMIEETGVY